MRRRRPKRPQLPSKHCFPAAESTLSAQRGLDWLLEQVETDQFRKPAPIGLYFAKLWYFERLYPIIFTVSALARAIACRTRRRRQLTCEISVAALLDGGNRKWT